MSAKRVENQVNQTTIKRVLRDKTSREYFKEGGWTNDPEEAMTFNDVVEVAETCARYGLINVEIALRVHSQGADVFCTSIR